MRQIEKMVEHVSAALREDEVKDTKGGSNAASEEITELIKKYYQLPDGRISKYCWQERYEGKDGKMHFGAVKPLSFEKFLEISNDPRLQTWQDEIRLLNEKYPQGGDDYEVEKKMIKNNFPLQTMHAYAFAGDMRRTDANALWNRKFVVDFDHFSNNHDENVREWLQAKMTPDFVKEQGIDYAYISVSGDGFHIVGSLRKGETISGAQLRICKALGLQDNEYDQKVYEPSRGSYFVHKSYWVIEPKEQDWYFTDLKEALEANEEGKRVLNYANNNVPKANGNVQNQSLVMSGNMPDNYNGAKWEHIVRCLINSLGGEPQVGSRHDMYGTLCGYLHGLVNNNPDWLFSILPHWNDDEEQYDQCEYACQDQTTGRPAKVVTAAVNAVKELTRKEKYNTDSLPFPPTTELDRLILSKTPDRYKVQMMMALPAIKGALFHNANYYNFSNFFRHFGFGVTILGAPASGKSFIKKALVLLETPLKEHDMEQKRAMDEYRDAVRKCRNKAKQPDDPKGYLSIIQPDTTLAKLAYYIENSNGDTMFMFSEELDELTRVESSKMSTKKVLFRENFDGGNWGQDRFGADSVTANGQVKINNIWLGTFGSADRFFDLAEIENGLASRQIFVLMPKVDVWAETPVFEDYTAKEKQRIIDLAYEMYSTKGVYYAPFVSNAVDEWKREKLIGNEGANDYKLQYIIRAAEIGERAAVMFAIEDGSAFKSPKSTKKGTQKEKNAIEYAIWMCEMVYRNAMLLFEDRIDRLATRCVANYSYSGKYCPKRLFNDLNTTFTDTNMEDLQDQHDWHPSIANILYQWKKTGKIIENEDGSYTKVK